jgi:hypothetical protein
MLSGSGSVTAWWLVGSHCTVTLSVYKKLKTTQTLIDRSVIASLSLVLLLHPGQEGVRHLLVRTEALPRVPPALRTLGQVRWVRVRVDRVRVDRVDRVRVDRVRVDRVRVGKGQGGQGQGGQGQGGQGQGG